MGIRETLRLVQGANALQESYLSGAGIRSPFTAGQLSQIVWKDILGTESVPVSRAEAMGIPAIARARHLLVTTIAKLPLHTYRRDQLVDNGPAWLYRTNLGTSPQHRMVMTVDDLIFYGWSLWACERTGVPIIDAGRIPAEWWKFDDDGSVLVKRPQDADYQPVDAASVILIPGYHEGILNSSPRTIRGARELETQWAQRAANPIPAVEIHQTDATELSDDEIYGLVDDWKTALSDQGGAVAFTPKSIELKTHGQAMSDLLVEGRNAVAIDAARIVGVPAAMIDASNVNSTLTYETLQGRSLEFVDYSVSLYTDPITARLSMDDVTPRGTRIAFDTTALTGLPPLRTGTPTED